jgi:DNA-binding transcriptional LysR family regulator
VELRHLRYFVAVAEDLSIRRAAERLHIEPPPLSKQIRALEQHIGAELLAREGRGRRIKLTEAGRVFLEHARKTLADANRGAALARQAAHGEIGNLAIGYNAPAEFRVFPKVVAPFQKKFPAVHLHFQSLNVAQQLEKLRRDELDVGFTWLPVPSSEFDVHTLFAEPLVAVLPADHRLRSARQVSIKDLTGERLILFPRLQYPDMYHDLERLFLEAGAALNVLYELESPLSVLNFVAMGLGCSLLPDYVRSIRHDGVIHKPVKTPTIVKSLAIIKKKNRRDLAETFYDFTIDAKISSTRSARPATEVAGR